MLLRPHYRSETQEIGQNGFLVEISEKFEMSCVESKTRTLGQILKNLCVCCRGLIFGRILMKLGQNVFLGEISDEFENWSCWVKN